MANFRKGSKHFLTDFSYGLLPVHKNLKVEILSYVQVPFEH